MHSINKEIFVNSLRRTIFKFNATQSTVGETYIPNNVNITSHSTAARIHYVVTTPFRIMCVIVSL